MKTHFVRFCWLTCIALPCISVGCQSSSSPLAENSSASGEKSSTEAHDHDQGEGDSHAGHDHGKSRHEVAGHAHGEGPHGGTIVDWGRGKYHLELTVDHEKKQATVYVLGTDEKTPVAIHTTDGTMLLTIRKPSFQVELLAQPQAGDASGAASQFVGAHENLGVEQELTGTISGEVEGTPYAGDFKEVGRDGHGHATTK